MTAPIDLSKFRIYRFEAHRLDPVTVFVEEIRDEASRITVQCYSRAWTAYWGSHGQQPVENFVASCNAEYVADNLKWGLNGLILKREEKHQYDYLVRIVEAIQNHWKQETSAAEAAREQS